MIKNFGIIYYPLNSIWSGFGLIKIQPYFLSKSILSYEINIENTKYIEPDYIFIKHVQVL